MNSGSVNFSDEGFADSFPFGFVADSAGAFAVIGAALERRLGPRIGQSVDALLEVVRPWSVKNVLDLQRNPGAAVLLRVRDSELELKGNVVETDGGSRLAFIGTPVVRDFEEVKARDLQLIDFPPSDATPDLLLSMQATKTALDDASNLSNELQSALIEAHAAVEAKVRFLAVMSHEIRTPLNGFGSMVDLLRATELDEDQHLQLDTMDECAHSLLALVNDILDLSKIEASGVHLERTPVDLKAAIERTIEQFRAEAETKNLELRFDVGEDVPPWIKGDARRLGQVVANLVGNAVKFTNRGSVVVKLICMTPGTVTVEVSDTGIGIPENARASLFDPFTQADSSVTRRFGGTGLGLAISREIARAMTGSIELTTSCPSGSTFRFMFRAEPCAEPGQPGSESATATERAQEDAILQGAEILVAEDNPMNQVIAHRLLTKLGARPTIVGDGRQAVEAVEARPFDMILMDLMMPVLAGTEATAEIRALDREWRNLPIIAFSAGAFEHDRADAEAAGMDGFLEKPVRLPVLRKLVVEHLRDAGKRARRGA